MDKSKIYCNIIILLLLYVLSIYIYDDMNKGDLIDTIECIIKTRLSLGIIKVILIVLLMIVSNIIYKCIKMIK